MLKSALAKIRTQLVLIVVAMVAAGIATVALGFTVYNALCLVVIPVAAAALTALIFFLLAAGALVSATIQPKKPEPEEPAGVLSSVDWARFAPLAGQIALTLTTIFTDRARSRRDDRRDDRRRR